jgi:hypothetical protein
MDFRLKDCCTLVAVSIAAYAVVAAFEGDIPRASACVLFTWVFDALDGLVARLTGGGTDFGARFDDVVDHVGYSVRSGLHRVRGFSRLFVGAWPRAVHLPDRHRIRAPRAIAHAAAVVSRLLDRPAAIGGRIHDLLLPELAHLPCLQLYIPAALLILVLGAMLLTYLPYRNHKAPMGPWGKLLWLVPVVSVGARPTGYMWDIALFFALVYLTTPLFYVSRAEKKSIDAAVLAWKRG